MDRHLSTTTPRPARTGLWTPWGPLRVPDLDKVLEPGAERRLDAADEAVEAGALPAFR